MKPKSIYLLILLMVFFSQSCSSTDEPQDTQDTDKVMTYKDEVQNLISICYKMKENGDLPNIDDGVDIKDQFKVGALQVFDRNALVEYPLTLNCIIRSKEKNYRFQFVKESKQNSWSLIKN